MDRGRVMLADGGRGGTGRTGGGPMRRYKVSYGALACAGTTLAISALGVTSCVSNSPTPGAQGGPSFDAAEGDATGIADAGGEASKGSDASSNLDATSSGNDGSLA